MIWEPAWFSHRNAHTPRVHELWVSEQSLFSKEACVVFWRTRRERAAQSYNNILSVSAFAPRAPSRNLFWVVKIKSWSRAPSADEKLFTHIHTLSEYFTTCAKFCVAHSWECTEAHAGESARHLPPLQVGGICNFDTSWFYSKRARQLYC